MSNFNWQTEEDVVWDDEAMAAETAVSTRRPWLTFLFIIAAITIAGTLIYRQVDERVETATEDVESDILASHQLLQQAAQQNDTELFKTLLSGRSAAWASLQTELVNEGRFYERDLLGLQWLSAMDESRSLPDVELDISPELNAAELRFAQEYAFAVGNGVTETVVLQQTAVYRRGSERWLYAPPDAEFWGEYTSAQGMILSLAYPERDAAIAEKLAFDLDAKLNDMCRTLPDLECPDNLRVHLRLSDDLESLWTFDPLDALAGGFRLELPTPTLMGLPVGGDGAGYQALYRGYATRLVTAVIPQLVGYECCEHAAFFQALLDYQLSQLGLRSWPVTMDDYSRVVSEGVDGYQLDRVWRHANLGDLSGLNGWWVYTAVDFILLSNPELSPAEMQRLIDRFTFAAWLQSLDAAALPVTPAADYLALFRRDWRAYAFQQTLAAQEPPPIPWPEQDIYLSCLDFEANLQRLDLTDMAWTTVMSGSPNNFVNPLPDKEGLIIQSFGFEDDETIATTIWWPNSDPQVMEHGHISVGQFAPDGRLMAYGLEGNSPVLVDVTDCPDGSCPLFPLAGLPVWSPDGSDFILLPEEALPQNQFEVNGRTYLFDQEQPLPEWPLYRGGTEPATSRIDEMIGIGYGHTPFWLDETTYGYVRQIPISSNSSDHELLLASTADDTPRTLLTEDELMAATPDRPSNSDLEIGIVMRHPTQPNLLFILAFYPSEMAYLFSYDVAEDVIDFHFRTEMNYFHSLGMSPDGRYLILAGTELETGPAPVNQILLYDLVSKQFNQFHTSTESFFAPANIYDWSSDSQWLALLLDDLSFLLVAPAYDYQRVVPQNSLGQCTNVIWLNK